MIKDKYLTICFNQPVGQHFTNVLEAIEFIEANLRESIKVQDVCNLSDLSPWQFQRVFRALVGDSIGNYIRGRRLTLAAYALQKSSSPARILDVAIEFQFGSQEAFSRAFKTAFGITPAEARSMPSSRLPTAKPKLDYGKLLQLSQGIKKEPKFQNFGSKTFIGLSMTIKSPLGIDTEFDGKAAKHWEVFDQRRSEIISRVSGYSYGFALSPGFEMEEESLTYLACVEVSDVSSVPDSMEVFSLPELQYAVFEVTGHLESCHVTTDYIYGIWLPQSEFARANGPDFELFDHKVYKRGQANSVSYYFLPIISK